MQILIYIILGSLIGMGAIYLILRPKLKTTQKINEKICELYPEYSDKEPHETNAMNKVMTWYGIEMKTFNDDSDSKIAEILLQGINMGIIEGRKLLNNKDVSPKIYSLIKEFIQMQEAAIETFKHYL